jgi:hypothetical protein
VAAASVASGPTVSVASASAVDVAPPLPGLSPETSPPGLSTPAPGSGVRSLPSPSTSDDGLQPPPSDAPDAEQPRADIPEPGQERDACDSSSDEHTDTDVAKEESVAARGPISR